LSCNSNENKKWVSWIWDTKLSSFYYAGFDTAADLEDFSSVDNKDIALFTWNFNS
jgi:hypothetical protein